MAIVKTKSIPIHKRERGGTVSLRLILGMGIVFGVSLLALAAAPQWWTDQGVLVPNASANDYAIANQGQLKNLALKAYAALQVSLPSSAWTTTNGAALTTLVQTLSATNNYAPLNLGQLKHVTKPFYDVLIENNLATAYPWTGSTNAPSDYALANLGQVKNLFNFNLPTTPSSPPDPVTDLLASADTAGEIDLSWTNPAGSTATSLLIQQQNTDGTWSTIATIDPTSSSYTITGLTAGQSYAYQILAANNAGVSAPSSNAGSGGGNSVSVKPAPCYAVVDLGKNNYPRTITNSGYVLLKHTGNYTTPTLVNQSWGTISSSDEGFYQWSPDAGMKQIGPAPSLVQGIPPTNPLDFYSYGAQWTGAVVNFLAEDGTMVGTVIQFNPDLDRENGTYRKLRAQWSFGSTTPTLSPPSISLLSALPYSDVEFITLDETVAIAGTAPVYDVWSSRYVYNNPSGIGDTSNISAHLFKNDTDLNNFAYIEYDLVKANSSGQTLTYRLSLTGEDSGYLDNQALPFAAYGLSAKSANGTTYVVGATSDSTSAVWWDGTIHTLPSGSAPPYWGYGANAAMSTAANTSSPVPAIQVIGGSSAGNVLWQMNPLTGSFGLPLRIDDLMASQPGWSGMNAMSINDGGAIVGTATKTSDSSSHGILLLPVLIQDVQVPASPVVINASVPTGADLNKGGNGIAFIIGDDGTANHAPKMPQLTAQINGMPGSTLQVEWKLDTHYAPRGIRDDKHYPLLNNSPSTIKLPINTPWSIYQAFGTDFFGGDCTLSFRILQADGTTVVADWQSFKFKIQGHNPDSSTAKAYIDANNGGFEFSWAVAKFESRQGNYTFNQFNTPSAKGLEGPLNYPEFGPADGWGMFQRDPTGDPGHPVLTTETWNWQNNVVAGVAELARKRQLAQAYFDAVQRTYSTQYETPPTAYTIAGTTTALSALDITEIQLYNHSSLAPQLLDPPADQNAQGTATDAYPGTFRFYPNNASGQKWVYVPYLGNGYDYVQKVILEHQNP